MSTVSCGRQLYSNSLYTACSFLDETEDLVKLGSEQIKSCQDASIWSKIIPIRQSLIRSRPGRSRIVDVLLHNLFVVDGISDINIGGVRHMRYSWVQVENIRRCILRVQVRVETLHQSCFALNLVSWFQSVRKERRTDPAMPIQMIVTGGLFSPASSFPAEGPAWACSCSTLDMIEIRRDCPIY